MEFKGSRGPWEVVDNGEYFEVRVKYSILDGVASTVDTQSCRDNGEHNNDGYAYANAHLIAAAPELLEALIELTESAKEAIDGLGDLADAIDTAKAAIAKALGQQ
ncbi:hypothetical protein V6478_001190 [Providencia rettgeri]